MAPSMGAIFLLALWKNWSGTPSGSPGVWGHILSLAAKSEAAWGLHWADLRLGRFAPRQFRKRATGHRPQPFQCDVSFFHALHEFFGDMLSALMVAAVWQIPADFLEHDVHIRGCPFFDFGHFDTKVGYRCQSIGVKLSRRRSISSRRPSAYCLADSPTKR